MNQPSAFFPSLLTALPCLGQGDVPEVCQKVPAPGGVLGVRAHISHPVDGAAQEPPSASGV